MTDRSWHRPADAVKTTLLERGLLDPLALMARTVRRSAFTHNQPFSHCHFIPDRSSSARVSRTFFLQAPVGLNELRLAQRFRTELPPGLLWRAID